MYNLGADEEMRDMIALITAFGDAIAASEGTDGADEQDQHTTMGVFVDKLAELLKGKVAEENQEVVRALVDELRPDVRHLIGAGIVERADAERAITVFRLLGIPVPDDFLTDKECGAPILQATGALIAPIQPR